MKNFITFTVILLFLASVSLVHAKSLVWDTPIGNTPIGGYKVSYSETEDVTKKWSNDVGLVTQVDLNIFNLTPNVSYTFCVLAYNLVGEGPDSNTVDYISPSFVVEDNPKQITIVVPGPIIIKVIREMVDGLLEQ